MAVLIGHASIDENNRAKNGLAGDQTGKEVCTRNYYKKDWDAVLRPVTSALAETSSRICEMITANDNVGYDQNQRNTLWKAYLESKQISPTKKVECDCSSFMTYCAILGGANIAYGSNAPTTSTMVAKFTAGGSYKALTDKKYLESSDYLERGDILVKKGSHTVMVLSNGSKVAKAPCGSIEIPQVRLKKGSQGKDVSKLQTALNTLFATGLDVDGDYGTLTETAVSETQKSLKNMGYYTSDIDGKYGPDNRKALTKYAKDKGYTVK